MTIKIFVYQKRGIKSDKLIDKFEFCCWMELKKWLDHFKVYGCSFHKGEAE